MASLTFNYKDIVKKSVEGIQEELVSEQVEMVRDYIKAAYRMKFENEKTIKELEDKNLQVDKAIEAADGGSLDEIKKLKIPTRFLSEKTARLNNLNWDQE